METEAQQELYKLCRGCDHNEEHWPEDSSWKCSLASPRVSDDGKCEDFKSYLYCHVCGNTDIVHESPAEGYWCPKCGSSDQDE